MVFNSIPLKNSEGGKEEQYQQKDIEKAATRLAEIIYSQIQYQKRLKNITKNKKYGKGNI